MVTVVFWKKIKGSKFFVLQLIGISEFASVKINVLVFFSISNSLFHSIARIITRVIIKYLICICYISERLRAAGGSGSSSSVSHLLT